METPFDLLCDVLPGRENWRFKVRVLRMWTIDSFMKPDEISSLELVLIDEKVCYRYAYLFYLYVIR
jgi:hypothetical protein